MSKPPSSLAERFWPHVDRSGGLEACWAWTGALDPQGKSGRVYDHTVREKRPAHEVSFEIAGGAIPEGAWVRWRCGNARCVNPAHLYLGPRYHRTTEERFWANVDRSGGPEACWPWTAARSQRQDYGKFGRWAGDSYPAHRMAYELTSGPLPVDMHVIHSCDNPPCCNPAHLFPGSPKDNSVDMVAKGRSLFGEQNPQALLTAEQVREIRRLHAAGGISEREIAARFFVHENQVQRIVTRRVWRLV